MSTSVFLLLIAPADYNAIMTTLTFSPGVDRQCVNVTLPDDGIVEGEETFNVTLTSNDSILLVPETAMVVIEESSSKMFTI